jgi:hypothetical protein
MTVVEFDDVEMTFRSYEIFGVFPGSYKAQKLDCAAPVCQSCQPEVSIEFLRQNVDAVLDAAERAPVHIRIENGRFWVVMLTEEYDRLTTPD